MKKIKYLIKKHIEEDRIELHEFHWFDNREVIAYTINKDLSLELISKIAKACNTYYCFSIRGQEDSLIFYYCHNKNKSKYESV